MDITVLVDGEAITSPTRFVRDLLVAQSKASFDIESDPARLEGRCVLTTVSPATAGALRERKLSYALLITPQEDFSGLDDDIVGGATAIFVVGTNHTLRVPLAGRAVTVPGARQVRERPLDARAPAAADDADGSDVNLLYPSDYLKIWESFVQQRAIPKRVGVLSSRRQLPPAWFLDKLRALGAEVDVTAPADAPSMDHPFLRRAGQLVRDNAEVDALDLDLLGLGRSIRHANGRDLRDNVSKEHVVAWSSLIRGIVKGEAPAEHEPGARAPHVQVTRDKPLINIVCFNPTYLFADLTKRFERAGCVHSELPIPDADAYIWMRPQELIAMCDLVRGFTPIDIPAPYRPAFEERKADYQAGDYVRFEKRSVAMHHGTCFEPIIQFDAPRLAKRLSPVAKVAGVCEFEPCYGPSASLANPHNYEFVPIGYDHTLFSEEAVNAKARKAKDKLIIGFVGRAYGTNNKAQLAASIYAHPRGYRKGGDHLINVLLRLKAMDVDFEAHIVGQNWDGHVELCEKYGLPVVYYARDKDISYRDYPKVYAGFDVLLVAARAEGGPVGAIEAMSVGVPVVGTSVGIIPYLAKTTNHCTMVEYDTKWHTMDYDAAVSALTKIYESPFDREQRLAVRRSVQPFTTDAWVERLVAMAHQLTSERQVRPA